MCLDKTISAYFYVWTKRSCTIFIFVNSCFRIRCSTLLRTRIQRTCVNKHEEYKEYGFYEIAQRRRASSVNPRAVIFFRASRPRGAIRPGATLELGRGVYPAYGGSAWANRRARAASRPRLRRRGDSRAPHVGPRNCTAAAERVKWLCVGHDGFEQGPCHANMFSK